MIKASRITLLILLLMGISIQSSFAYEIPQRKIEIKPYLNLFFPSDLWEKEDVETVVDNKTSFGFGAKIRTQFINQFGIVLNASYINFETLNNSSNDGVIFTGGGYYGRSFGFGDLTFDFGYGIIIAAEEVLGLVMPSLEYSRPVSDRMSIAFELGLPIPNDWPRSMEYKENFSSFTLSVGTVIIF